MTLNDKIFRRIQEICFSAKGQTLWDSSVMWWIIVLGTIFIIAFDNHLICYFILF